MSRRRRAKVLVAAGVAVAAAGGGTAAVGFGGTGGGAAGTSGLPPTTAQVTRSTLTDSETVDGTLGYGTETAMSGRLPGTVTWLPAEGATVKRGQRLYTVDDEPVVLMRGRLPMYRDLHTGLEGADVKLFEENLAALGYDGFTVDDSFSSATAAAVEEWQEDLGLPETGRVRAGQVVYAPGDVRVADLKAQVGDATGPGRQVLSHTGTTRVVTVRLDIDQQRLVVAGTAASVELPDGRAVSGKVSTVDTIIDPGSQNQEPETRLEVTLALTDQKGLGTLDRATVEVTFVASKRENVLSVPVAALLALAEGGYGVQVVEGTGTRIVPVEVGMFSGGRVEVTGDGLAEGMSIGVAA